MSNSQGKLGILLPGMGAVATTFIAGVEAIRRGRTAAIGSLTQLGTVDIDGAAQPIRDALRLPDLDDVVFGGWDIYDDTCADAAVRAGVLNHPDMEALKEFLATIRPMPACFEQEWVKNLSGTHLKTGSKWERANQLLADIANFKATSGADRLVGVWCGSTEKWTELQEVHLNIAAFEQGLRNDHPGISPAMMYAWAMIKSGVPYANGAPNRALDTPALTQLAAELNVPIAGRDFKTGQTLMKTVLAPGLAARKLAVRGWYSTNILGNRDGIVLDDPGSFRTKEESKLSVLDVILDKEEHPELYGDLTHKVRIDYYPPRGDDKEGWDNIDIAGWLGYPMQIKVNFLCKDSILAAPLVLDLALLLDAAARNGKGGVQEWLSFFFKAPQPAVGTIPVHDLFEQRTMLFDELQKLGARAK